MPIGTDEVDGAARARRAGWLVTAASALVALAALVIVATVPPGPARTVALLVLVAAAFGVALWRAARARRDPTPVRGLRPISSWIAAFSWGATVFTVLIALAAPGSGVRAAVGGLLVGSVLVLAGRASERAATRE